MTRYEECCTYKPTRVSLYSKMSEEDCAAHVMGVLMAEHYSMKKAKELFSAGRDMKVTTKKSNLPTQ